MVKHIVKSLWCGFLTASLIAGAFVLIFLVVLLDNPAEHTENFWFLVRAIWIIVFLFWSALHGTIEWESRDE